jgi:N-acetylneuraminate synthase
MANCTFRDCTIIENFKTPFIVAEVNTSHNGNFETAKDMIKNAKECGCNCVKFQSWTAETLNSGSYYSNNPIAKRMFTKFSFTEDTLLQLSLYAKEIGISFSSTPYSKREVDFLVEKTDAPFIKVASMDINNYPFLDYISRTGAPIVLATGMGDMDEIKIAVETIEKAGGKNLCLLHCISIYPPEISTIQLNNIIGLRETFPDYPIGFSDHSLGIEMAAAATALGTALIEKHLTLDKNKIGMDNQMAINPDEMSQMVKNCRNISIALGNKERIISKAELEQRSKMRRSVVYTRDIKAGEILTEKDFDTKRPGTGLQPYKIYELIGKTLVRNVENDKLVLEQDIQ